MKQSFTLNQLIKLLYNETSANESNMLHELMELIPEMKTEYRRLKAAKDSLDFFRKTPSDDSISTILTYSKRRAILA